MPVAYVSYPSTSRSHRRSTSRSPTYSNGSHYSAYQPSHRSSGSHHRSSTSSHRSHGYSTYDTGHRRSPTYDSRYYDSRSYGGHGGHRSGNYGDSGHGYTTHFDYKPTFMDRVRWLFGMGHKTRYHDMGKRHSNSRQYNVDPRTGSEVDRKGRPIYTV